jgi:hypothetical protein
MCVAGVNDAACSCTGRKAADDGWSNPCGIGQPADNENDGTEDTSTQMSYKQRCPACTHDWFHVSPFKSSSVQISSTGWMSLLVA